MEERVEDGGDSCRICRGEGTPEQPLFYPCKCSGSIKFVHQDCLMEWLSHSQKKYCELCKTPFRFTKLYVESMPEFVPWPLFIRQLFLHSCKSAGKWMRYSLAISIWLCWLPWTIRQIWRGLFWVADGSWLSTQDMRSAVQTYASHIANQSSPASSILPLGPSNVTLGVVGGTTSSILLSTLSAVIGLVDPGTFLRAVLRLLVSIAIHPNVVTESISWSDGALLFAHFPRPPSLLSDFHSIASATRFPILNNAFIDILEGQLVCLAIVTAFILVFLIREWVINQQPLLNLPDPDPAQNPAVPPRDEPRRAARRRRRNLRQLPAGNPEVGEGPILPAHPRIRRAATENNILIQNHASDQVRPEPPQRAASLVPALQELEDDVRSLGEYANIPTQSSPTQNAPLESPPLQRGVFDDVGYIRRSIEEREVPVSLQASHDGDQGAADTILARGNIVPAAPVVPGHIVQTDELPEPTPQNGSVVDERVDGAEEEWVSDSATEVIATPESLPDTGQDQTLPESSNNPSTTPSEDLEEHHINTPSEHLSASDQVDLPPALVEVESVSARISRWLWHTDEYLDGDVPAANTDGTDTVVNADGDGPLGPAAGHPARPLALVPAAPAPLDDAAPNVQNGVDANVANMEALDDAEDIEGIMELLGMEGPIAGMIQNIVFSVFLITLTLSASIWCPYIWGKITLLFVAHPYSVFVKAPLYMLSRTADVIVDIGLFSFGVIGMLLNHFTKVAKASLSVMAPSLSGYINPDWLDSLSMSLSRKSGARLEKTFMRAVLGFRPDLPTFSVQAHHVLRVFSKTGTEAFRKSSSNLASYDWTTLTWYQAFTTPVHLGSLARELPDICSAYFRDLKVWHAQLQEDLRPLSFSDPTDIDYSLVEWSSKEKIACIALGYTLFCLIGYIYLKVAPYLYGLRKGEKVSGFLADTLRQSGGVMKVIIIIGIEMIVFPLYCGTMLDFALLPIFEGASVQTRLQFFASTPLTALFVHWFIGTCYMFHFALFVSMCRKIMRKGVLYFIRDPDDPTFHPVRDVLERPVITQLGKIAFSAFVYGSLLLVCLGGVIAGLDRVGGILPLRWGIGDTVMIMPGDIVFFNFLLPFVLRKVDLADKLSIVFEWWFRACAAGLRLSDFMFGVDYEKEKAPAPFLWKQFFNRLLFADEDSSPVKDLKEVAKNPERLLWLEAREASTIESDVREAAGSTIKYKNVHQFRLDNTAQALFEFEDVAAAQLIKQEVNERCNEPGRTRIRAKSISEINIDVRSARDSTVDLSAGTYVRAPAKDSVRIPKGTNVFVHVNEKDERLDGVTDSDEGLHGKKNESFSRLYVPNHFKARMITFIGMVWAFIAIACLSLSVGPLLLGRFLVSTMSKSSTQVNDLYTVTIGIHALCIITYTTYIITSQWRRTIDKISHTINNTRQLVPWVVATTKMIVGLIYLTISLGVLLPLALSLITELYINIPLLGHLLATEEPVVESHQRTHLSAPVAGFSSTPIINLIQSWTLGLLYLRLIIRLLKTTPHENSRPAVAIRRITRKGLLRPDIRLATRAVILPVAIVCIVLLGLPPLLARSVLAFYPQNLNGEERVNFYRYAYPISSSVTFAVLFLLRVRRNIDNWRYRIRDEVYLIGERLHNFPVQDDSTKRAKQGRKRSVDASRGEDKGKGKARVMSANDLAGDLLGSDTGPMTSAPKESRMPEDGYTSATIPTSEPNASKVAANAAIARAQQDLRNRQLFQQRNKDGDIFDDDIPTSSTSTSPQHNPLGRPRSLLLSPDLTINDQEGNPTEPPLPPRRPSLTMDIDEFRSITGLHDVAGAEDIGDVGRLVFGVEGEIE